MTPVGQPYTTDLREKARASEGNILPQARRRFGFSSPRLWCSGRGRRRQAAPRGSRPLPFLLAFSAMPFLKKASRSLPFTAFTLSSLSESPTLSSASRSSCEALSVSILWHSGPRRQNTLASAGQQYQSGRMLTQVPDQTPGHLSLDTIPACLFPITHARP